MLKQTEHPAKITVCIGLNMINSTCEGMKFYLFVIEKENPSYLRLQSKSTSNPIEGRR
jgi:hypothetical protein